MSSAGPGCKGNIWWDIHVLRPLTPGLRQALLLMIALFSHVYSLYFALWTTVTLRLQCCVCVCVELTKTHRLTGSCYVEPRRLVFVMHWSSHS